MMRRSRLGAGPLPPSTRTSRGRRALSRMNNHPQTTAHIKLPLSLSVFLYLSHSPSLLSSAGYVCSACPGDGSSSGTWKQEQTGREQASALPLPVPSPSAKPPNAYGRLQVQPMLSAQGGWWCRRDSQRRERQCRGDGRGEVDGCAVWRPGSAAAAATAQPDARLTCARPPRQGEPCDTQQCGGFGFGWPG